MFEDGGKICWKTMRRYCRKGELFRMCSSLSYRETESKEPMGGMVLKWGERGPEIGEKDQRDEGVKQREK